MIANQGDGDDGYVGERLLHHSAVIRRFWREDPESFDQIHRETDLLVLLGSDWSVYDEDFAVSIDAERALISRAQAADLPILGICFGGQQISSSLGLGVFASSHPEIGWKMINSKDEGMISPGPWFQYHVDTWGEGEVVSMLATSAGGPQAYWYGKSLVLQFHPEVTFATIERWCDEGRIELERVGADFDQIINDSRMYLPKARERCFDLVDRFLQTSSAASYPRAVLNRS